MKPPATSVSRLEIPNFEQSLFERARSMAPADRSTFLLGACSGDASLAGQIEALIRADESSGDFMAVPAAAVARVGLAAKSESAESGRLSSTDPNSASREVPGFAGRAASGENPSERIGRYRVLEKIGDGGFGIVYRAAQDAPVHRQVALKILKPGMDTREVVARFEAERQALALMDHPSIATVFDGGATETGRPYFVMELVEGVPITRFCDEQGLTVRQRVELCITVCRAVQHAHQKGVIHRDLKPSNILVTAHDGEPRPKVIDFGIAKAIERPFGEQTAFTRLHAFVGTPTYMSPEQAQSGGGDVDTRSDIYSLGVLLYELLAGRPPFDPNDLAAPGYAEFLRILRDVEPLPPSQRVAVLRGDERDQAARRRGADAARLIKSLRGDLDRIALKCLQKDRGRRYETAYGLAMDLQRHLNHEPVLARPATASYRIGRFVHRHRVPVALSVGVVVTLLGGLASTVVQARRATHHATVAESERKRASDQARIAGEQRDFALRQLSRAEAVNELNAFLLSDAAPEGERFTSAELLARAERIMDQDDAAADENRVEILIGLGSQYQSMEEDAKARRLLGKAFELSRRFADRALRAKASAALAGAVATAGEFERAEGLFQQALAELSDESQYALTRVFCLTRGSAIARESGNAQLGVERIEEAQRLLRASGQASPLHELKVSIDVGESYRLAGRYRDAIAAFELSFAQLTALGRDRTERAGTLLNNWGLALHHLGNPLEAERLFRRAIAINQSDRTENGVSPMLLNNLAWTLFQLRRLDEAADYAERAGARALALGEEIAVNQSLNLRAYIYRQRNELQRADEMLAELEPRWRSMMPDNYVGFVVLASQRSEQALARGDAEAAWNESERAFTLAATSPQGRNVLPMLVLRRARILQQLGRLDEARAEAQRALALRQEAAGGDAPSSHVGEAHLQIARVLVAQAQENDAGRAYTAALEHLIPTLGSDHPDVRDSTMGLNGLATK